MNGLNEEDDVEIVDLDQCSKKVSILIGSAVTMVLSFVPYSWILLGLHIGIGALAGVGHFTKKHAIRLSFLNGGKIGALVGILGIAAFYVVGPFWYIQTITDEEWTDWKEQIIETYYEKGNPELAKELEKVDFASMTPHALVVMAIFLVLIGAVLGFIGGGVGAAIYKRGPEAQ